APGESGSIRARTTSEGGTHTAPTATPSSSDRPAAISAAVKAVGTRAIGCKREKPLLLVRGKGLLDDSVPRSGRRTPPTPPPRVTGGANGEVSWLRASLP